MAFGLVLSLAPISTPPPISRASGADPGISTEGDLPIPHLTGHFTISLTGGTLAGDACLTNIASQDDSVTIVLNSGLRIRSVTGAIFPAVREEIEPGGAAIRHTFLRRDTQPDPQTGEDSPETICLEYSGAFPVYDPDAGNYRETDESSVIAFTGSLLRARGISRWHPTVYTPSTGLAAEAMTFVIDIQCAECNHILVNGVGIEAGPSARFETDTPRELLLVAGDLAVREAGGITFIGRDVPEESAESFASTVGEVITFLEGYTTLPFGDAPRVVTIPAVRAPRRGQLWGFLSDPVLAIVGMTVPEVVEALESTGRPRQAVLGFVAHELAHRYFGWRLGGGSPQRDLFGEPFAVYLEMKALRFFEGDAAYTRSLQNLREAAAQMNFPALPDADADSFAGSGYRYTFAPAALFSLEDRIGEELMRATLAELLRAPEAERYLADFSFLEKAAKRAGVTSEIWAQWKGLP
ncbi:MAG: hypothetical protein LBG44_03770 [Gemmatimonadota bacterium]|jgi:hypothetical protein|nr:hypothetical protein [Gemmatimonadota bacterium]